MSSSPEKSKSTTFNELPSSDTFSGASETIKNTTTSTSPPAESTDAISKGLSTEGTTGSTGKTLNENAAEYLESRAATQKRKYDEVEVITGEENEHNVLQMSAKLYVWDKNKLATSSSSSKRSPWVEKGQGQLRLNDLAVPATSTSSSSSATCLSGTHAR